MEKCICCGKSGVFVRLNKDGLCSQCVKDTNIIMDFKSSTNAMKRFFLNNDIKEFLKVRNSTSAQKRIKKRKLHSFEKIFFQYQKARTLEKKGNINQALVIYLSLVPYRPEGTDYYTRPCIILENQKRYQEAIEICDIAIQEIEAEHFNADVQEFVHRRERLMKKREKNTK